MKSPLYPIRLGMDLDRRTALFLPHDSFRTHYHLVGATGAGKTNSIHTFLRTLMKEPAQQACIFVLDPMGNLSRDILRWMASRECPEHVRRRLLYIEPAREEVVIPFNPLTYTTEANFYYQVARAVDLVLRAWRAQDLGMQPRLMQWSYKAMCAMATLNYPLAMSEYLLHTGTEEHKAILRQIPENIANHWQEILNAKGGESTKILDSTRNRFDPFFNSVILKRMFGSTTSGFDAERFIRERRIVIVNLAKLGKVPGQLGNTIGALLLNEVFETASNMTTLQGRAAVDPTYVLLDEFQRYAASPDIEDALPTVRQMGLRLILAHQSFSQLEQGDIDLSNMIWQARSRLMFANNAEDADIIANELATLTFDPMSVKDMRTSVKQLIVGYRREWLEAEGLTRTHAESVIDQRSVGYNQGEAESWALHRPGRTLTDSKGRSDGRLTGGTRADSHADSRSRHEVNVPIHETIEEISNITYTPFDEHRLDYARRVRQLDTGVAFAKLTEDKHLHQVLVDHDPVEPTPAIEAAVEELIAQNFEQDMFRSREECDRLAEIQRQQLLTPPKITLNTTSNTSHEPTAPSPFRQSKPHVDE